MLDARPASLKRTRWTTVAESPSASGRRLAAEPGSSVPSAQTRFVVPEHEPWLVSADRNDAFPGASCSTVTPCAMPGPLLRTVIV